MTSRFWARFDPSVPRVIAVPGLAKSLAARTARPPALAVAARRVDAALRPDRRARHGPLRALSPAGRAWRKDCPGPLAPPHDVGPQRRLDRVAHRQDADSARAAMRIHLTNSRERLRLAQKTSAA